MESKTRGLCPDELQFLKALKTRTEKASPSWIRLHHYILAGVLGAGCTYLAIAAKAGFWCFLFGTVAVLAFCFMVFTPYEVYKQRRKHHEFLERLTAFIDSKMVVTYSVSAIRIALAKEYEDESDLYIVELDGDAVLYLYDLEYSLNGKFPCLRFEVYEDAFFLLTGKQIYPLSDIIKPVAIDPKRKWEYMRQMGAPEHLSVENIPFDKLIEKINA